MRGSIVNEKKNRLSLIFVSRVAYSREETIRGNRVYKILDLQFKYSMDFNPNKYIPGCSGTSKRFSITK